MQQQKRRPVLLSSFPIKNRQSIDLRRAMKSGASRCRFLGLRSCGRGLRQHHRFLLGVCAYENKRSRNRDKRERRWSFHKNVRIAPNSTIVPLFPPANDGAASAPPRFMNHVGVSGNQRCRRYDLRRGRLFDDAFRKRHPISPCGASSRPRDEFPETRASLFRCGPRAPRPG